MRFRRRRTTEGSPTASRAVRATRWSPEPAPRGGAGPAAEREQSRLDRALFPLFGPADIGPYDDDEPLEPVDLACSTCGYPMSEHVTDRSGGRSRITCPPLARSRDASPAGPSALPGAGPRGLPPGR